MPKIVNSWNEWDPLKHVIVGRADNCCIPPAEPATDAKIPEDSDLHGIDGPRSDESIIKANVQLDNFAIFFRNCKFFRFNCIFYKFRF